MSAGGHSALAVYQGELDTLRRQGFAILKDPPPGDHLVPCQAGQRSARITAAVDQYQAELAALAAAGRTGKTYGVLKVICLRLGVKPSAVCQRMKREAAHGA